MKTQINSCLNCSNKLDETSKYCPNCGQDKSSVTLSFNQIVKEAFSSFFNLDSRIFHTLRDIYLPHKLTKAYVEGKRKYYVNPAKLFLFTLISLISLLLITGEFNINDSQNINLASETTELKISKSFDSIAQKLSSPIADPILDTLRTELFKDTTITNEFDDINLKLFGVDISEYKFSKTDIVELSTDTLLKKYQITSFKERLIVGQFLHFYKDTSGGVKFFIKNFTYVTLLLVFLAALVLKLLHFRRPFYYVEHLVLLLYGHVLSFMFIALIILDMNNKLTSEILSFVSVLCMIALQYLSFKKYYKQGKLKTILKLVIFNITYFMLFLICSIIIGIISLLIF